MTFTPTENGTTLRGWFLKEKRDKFKRRQSIVSTSSNRRWFQIERLESGENALSYYRRQPKQEEQPTGFFFLNDIISLSQDIPKKMITIEHPSRTLRLESPSIAQHTHSYSALVRSCPKATKSDHYNDGIGNSTPSHSFSSSLTTARRNSTTGETTTAKDELKFLREITGNNNLALSHTSLSSSESGIRDISDSSSESEKENFAPRPPTTENEEEEEEKSAVEPLYYHGNGREDDGTEGAFSVEKLIAALPMTNEIPKSNSFASQHQIQRSSSYRHHFDNEDIQPDEDFLHDDWDD